MQTPYPAAMATPPAGGILTWPRRAVDFLDARGRGAWIATMVMGFVLFWPVGLALVLFMSFTNRWSKTKMLGRHCTSSHRHSTPWGGLNAAPHSTGNAAFDAYRAEMLKRLEDEQIAFEAFLTRLREAKDKQEFDAFMSERARKAGEAGPERDMPPAVG